MNVEMLGVKLLLYHPEGTSVIKVQNAKCSNF